MRSEGDVTGAGRYTTLIKLIPSTLRPPDIIPVTGVPRPFPIFHALLPPCIILNANQRTKKNGVGLGTRLVNSYIELKENV